jgi:hypothetical protein
VDLNHLLDGGPFESAKGEGSGQRLKSPHSSRAPTDERNDMSDEIGEMLCAVQQEQQSITRVVAGCRLRFESRRGRRKEGQIPENFSVLIYAKNWSVKG